MKGRVPSPYQKNTRTPIILHFYLISKVEVQIPLLGPLSPLLASRGVNTKHYLLSIKLIEGVSFMFIKILLMATQERY